MLWLTQYEYLEITGLQMSTSDVLHTLGLQASASGIFDKCRIMTQRILLAEGPGRGIHRES